VEPSIVSATGTNTQLQCFPNGQRDTRTTARSAPTSVRSAVSRASNARIRVPLSHRNTSSSEDRIVTWLRASSYPQATNPLAGPEPVEIRRCFDAACGGHGHPAKSCVAAAVAPRTSAKGITCMGDLIENPFSLAARRATNNHGDVGVSESFGRQSFGVKTKPTRVLEKLPAALGLTPLNSGRRYTWGRRSYWDTDTKKMS